MIECKTLYNFHIPHTAFPNATRSQLKQQQKKHTQKGPCYQDRNRDVATLSLKPIAYDKPIDPSEMPRISKCTDTMMDDTNVPTKDDKYPWLELDDK